MTCVVLGASSGLGRCVAERLAATGANLILASRDARDAEAEAADLFLRYGVRTIAIAIDLAQGVQDFSVLDSAIGELGAVNVVVVTAGEVSDEDSFPLLPATAEALLRTNFLSICLYINHLLPRLERGSLIVGIGSVAAFRGRARNMIYSASKRALASFFESSRDALWRQQVRVQFYHVGYLDTKMSFGRNLRLPVASADSLARRIVKNLPKGSGVFYYPRVWCAIHFLVRATPSAIWHGLRA